MGLASYRLTRVSTEKSTKRLKSKMPLPCRSLQSPQLETLLKYHSGPLWDFVDLEIEVVDLSTVYIDSEVVEVDPGFSTDYIGFEVVESTGILRYYID